MRAKKISCIVGIAVLCIVALSVAPFGAYGADKLLVNDSSSNVQFDVTDTGTLLLPTATGQIGIGTANPQSQVYVVDQTGTNVQRGMITAQHSNTATAAVIQFKRSRGTEAAPLALLSGDNAGAFHSFLYDGSSYFLTASIIFQVNGTVTTGAIPTDIQFRAGQDTTRPERMRITSTGNVGIGNTAPGHLLTVGTSGAYSDGGTWVNGSSREFKDNIETLSAKEAIETVKI